MVDQSKSNVSDLLYSISNDDLHLLHQDSQNSNEHYLSSISGSSTSNIIGTHPNEIITSINPDNGYPVRQENGQRKTGPPPGIVTKIDSSSYCTRLKNPLFRLANNSTSSRTWLRSICWKIAPRLFRVRIISIV